MPTTSVLQVSPLSFDQNNPFLAGLQKGQTIGSNFQNQDLVRQQIQAAQYANQMARAQAQYAQPTALAELLQKQAQPELTQAQAAQANAIAQLHGTQAQLAQKGLPYAGGSAQADMQQKQANALQTGIANQVAGASAPSNIFKNQASAFSNPIYSNALQQSRLTGEPIKSILQRWGVIPSDVPLPAPNAGNQGAPSPQNTQQGGPNILPVNPNQMADQAARQAMALPPTGMTPQMSGSIQQALGGPQTLTPATAPKLFSGNTEQNVGLYGSPLNPYQMAGAKAATEAQAKTNVTAWNNLTDNLNKDADNATKLNNALNQFSDAYDKSKLTGPGLGAIPVKGKIGAAINYLSHDVTNEQEADQASKNMQGLVAHGIFPQRTTNTDLAWLQDFKPGRENTPLAKQSIVDFMQKDTVRQQELANMAAAARQMGVDPKTTDTLLNNYNNQRPVYNWYSRKPNDNFMGTWPEYLDPRYIASVQAGKGYVIPPKFSDAQQAADWQKTLAINTGKTPAATNWKASSPAVNPEQVNQQMAVVQAPNGQQYHLPADQADRLLKDHPDHKRVS